MDEEEREREFIVAAFLHDIGKLIYRAGAGENHQTLGAEWINARGYSEFVSGLVQEHHSIANENDQYLKWIQKADHLSAMQRQEKPKDEKSEGVREIPLYSIFNEIELSNPILEKPKFIPLRPLSIREREIFPLENMEEFTGPTKAGGRSLSWGFSKLLSLLDEEFNKITNKLYDLITIDAVIRKYTWCVPSAAYKGVPDIALYNHMKDCAAYAACLYKNEGNASFMLIGGDFSGIQNYIFNISNLKGVARRLRGRSFELVILARLIVSIICEQLKLPPFNIVYASGGTFYILAPSNDRIKEKIEALKAAFNKWFLKRYDGILTLNLVFQDFNEEESKNFNEIIDLVNNKFNSEKIRKFGINEGNINSVFLERVEKESWSACSSCNFQYVKDEESICDNCNEHEQIGRILPRTKFIIELFDDKFDVPREKILYSLIFSDDSSNFFHHQYLFVEEGDREIINYLNSKNIKCTLFKLNDTSDFILLKNQNQSNSYLFLGTMCPFFLKEYNDNEVGSIVSFDDLAKMSIGAEKLGFLKGDVDNLGLIFSLGLERDGSPSNRTLSRLSTLSSMFDIFFSGYIQEIVTNFSEDWKKKCLIEITEKLEKMPNLKELHVKKKLIESSSHNIYLLYSGGDDFLIIGPWDAIIKLSHLIREKFKAFTCGNPNVTLSAGIFLSEAKYPVKRAVKIANKFEEISKALVSKNALTVFGETRVWDDFQQLQQYSEELETYLKEKIISKSFLYYLLYLNRRTEIGTSRENLMWIPWLHYQITRNILTKKEIKNEEIKPARRIKQICQLLLNNSDPIFNLKNIIYPASWVSLRVR